MKEMRWRPFLLSALAVTALLALAASAAGTRPLSAAGTRSGASLPSSLFDYTLTTLAIVMGVALVVVVISLPFGVSSGERRSPSRDLRTILLVILGIFLVVVLRHFILGFLHQLREVVVPPGGHVHGGGGTTGTVVPHPERPSGTPTFRWDELLLVAGLVLFAALLVFGLRPRPSGRGDGGAAETLAEAISESLDDLRTDPDLRRAIEAAYARMERALALIGVPRDPAEGPYEYLERALLSVDASAGAVRRLTELFEQVKFSNHEPDARMRDDAIDALVAIRDELGAARAVAA